MNREKPDRANELITIRASVECEKTYWDSTTDASKIAGKFKTAFESEVAPKVFVEIFDVFRAEVLSRLNDRLAEIDREFEAL